MTKNSIFFNHSFEKKRLKALISWIHKTFGEKEALRVVDELKITGFINATRAGLSIGLHDLITPPEKPLLISKAQVAMNKTDQDFKGGKITATERSQRIIDTWHRTSDTLRKQVVDHFNTYDQLNSVYIMALSGARGNFSQVRQLIGMRGLMADPQGQIISFPIRSNFREGLTLTEYFISCSGARKGLVDTALRTADTGYLTRRLVDVSHQVVIKRVACNTSRGIVIKALQTGPVGGSNKIMLSLKDRLIGRVLAEDIKILGPFGAELLRSKSCQNVVPTNVVFERNEPETSPNSTAPLAGSTRPIVRSVNKSASAPRSASTKAERGALALLLTRRGSVDEHSKARRAQVGASLWPLRGKLSSPSGANRPPVGKGLRPQVGASLPTSPSGANRPPIGKALRAQVGASLPTSLESQTKKLEDFGRAPNKIFDFVQADSDLVDDPNLNQPPCSMTQGTRSYKLATRDSEISPNLAFKIACLRDRVIVRSSLTCACTHEVCQLCYGWSLSQGKLVSLGEAVGVIAAQSIGEPGTQLTMRTFHTGGVFSGDLLQDIRAPHAGKVFFPQALQGLLVRTAQGQIAFLIKIPGVLLLDDGKSQVTRIQLEAATMIFVRQGEVIESNTILGELAVMTKEGNQPIKSRQTLFAEFGGRVTHHRGRTLKVHKPETEDEPLSAVIRWHDGEELDLVKDAEEGIDRLKNGFRFIEPTHSLSLGVFRILATRVGAKESHLSRVQFTEPKLRFSEPHLRPAPAQWAQVVERTAPLTNRSQARRDSGRFVLAGSTTKGYFANVRGESNSLNFALANRADGRPRLVEPSRAVGRRPDLVQALFDKKRTTAAGRRDASALVRRRRTWPLRGLDTFRASSYVLNTIAEEGDLVDDNYKDCTSSFQFAAPALQNRTPPV